VILGLLLATACGLCWGIFLAPVRVIKAWKWENIWLVWSFFATVVGPWVMAFWCVPHLLQVDHEVGASMLLLTTFLGGVSGTAGFLYSYSVPVIGLGLATSLNAGASMAMSLLPLGVLHRETLLHRSGGFTLLGVVLAVVGTSLCGDGGRRREQATIERNDASQSAEKNRAFWKCVLLTLASGAIGTGMNIALAFPNPIFTVAHKYGGGDFAATCAFLAPYLLGAFIGNAIYAGTLLRKNNSFPQFFAKGSLLCLFLSIFMAVVFLFGEYSYAGAVSLLGSFGAVITWGLSVAAMILTSSLWDVSQGEWGGRAARQMALGVGVLMVAVVSLGLAQYFYRMDW
jgi:L-rhamnose-H+ transport protein